MRIGIFLSVQLTRMHIPNIKNDHIQYVLKYETTVIYRMCPAKRHARSLTDLTRCCHLTVIVYGWVQRGSVYVSFLCSGLKSPLSFALFLHSGFDCMYFTVMFHRSGGGLVCRTEHIVLIWSCIRVKGEVSRQ